MSNFITTTDYKTKVTDNRLNMIIESDQTILDEAELTAIATTRDFLYSRYDVDTIFALTGTARPMQVVRWCVNLAIYYIYERIPDKLTPDRIKDNYHDTLALLLDISDGKKAVDLPHKEDAEGYPESKFRWGSQLKRSHN